MHKLMGTGTHMMLMRSASCTRRLSVRRRRRRRRRIRRRIRGRRGRRRIDVSLKACHLAPLKACGLITCSPVIVQ
jgi:hypothetical protein